MICEKCSKEYDDNLTACPRCDKAKENGEKFRVNIPQDTAEKVKPEPKKKRPVKKKTASKSEKTSRLIVMALSCVMAVITALVAVLGAATDVFKGTDVKAVTVLILPQEDKQELENHLSKLWPMASTGFDTEKMTVEELMGYIKPYCENGLYTSFGYSATAITHEADPAGRFKDGEGNYCYFKIPAEEIDSILKQFNVQSNHAVNNKNYYYYDSHYYFSWGESSDEKSSGKITVGDSKRIQDGRYYVPCTFGKKEVYVIASIEEKDDSRYWKIHSMSLTPVFDNLGIMIKDEASLADDYEIRQLIIEGKTDDGTVFKKYVIKYPHFFGDSQGEIQANSFYQSIITYYQQQAQQVQSDYKKFLKRDGKTEALPWELHYEARVSYTDDEKLCLINEISESELIYEKTDTSDEQKESVVLPKKTLECYTFDTQTGLFVSKDSIIGKDYHKISEILYRIYSGYSYADLVDENAASEEVPEDKDNLGEKIYNSASTLCQDGYVFCYVTDDGMREDVVIPFDIIDKITETAEE